MEMTEKPAEQIRKARNLLAEGQQQEAVRIYESLIEMAGDDPELNMEMGHLCFEVGSLEQSGKHYRVIVNHDPGNASYLGYLGVVLERQDRSAEAAKVLERAMDLGCDSEQAFLSMGSVCMEFNDNEKASRYLEKARTKNPGNPDAYVGLAIALPEIGNYEQALYYGQEALRLGARSENAYFVVARLLTEMGRFDEAIEQLEETVKQHETLGTAYLALTKVKEFSEKDQYFIDKTEKILERSMPMVHRQCIRFALGKMHDDCRNRKAAFEHYKKGNLLQARPHNTDGDLRFHKKTARYMYRFALSKVRHFGHESAQPVFVVGMPRSGTTLIESIIAAHPQAEGAGELTAILNIKNDLVSQSGRRALARARADLTGERLEEYAEQYLRVLRQGREGAARIVDKMPANYMDLGLITTLFPNATIIHAIRHPLDIALSCYFQRFTNLFWANDFHSIARVYAEYRRTMAYWKKVLPEGRIVDVHYEDLVQDQEGQGKRLLDACGLSWDGSVLDFYQRDTVVRTASLGQVREPIYDSSRMRWKAYAPWLEELVREMEPYLPESRDQLIESGVPLPREGWFRRFAQRFLG